MPTVHFTYDQKAVVTCKAMCEVPEEVLAAGDDAVKQWLSDNMADWDDDEVVSTDYDEYLGHERYEILHRGD